MDNSMAARGNGKPLPLSGEHDTADHHPIPALHSQVRYSPAAVSAGIGCKVLTIRPSIGKLSPALPSSSQDPAAPSPDKTPPTPHPLRPPLQPHPYLHPKPPPLPHLPQSPASRPWSPQSRSREPALKQPLPPRHSPRSWLTAHRPRLQRKPLCRPSRPRRLRLILTGSPTSIRSRPRKRRDMPSGRLPSVRSGPKKRGSETTATPRLGHLGKEGQTPLAIFHVRGQGSLIFLGVESKHCYFLVCNLPSGPWRPLPGGLYLEACGQMSFSSCTYFTSKSLEALCFSGGALGHSILVQTLHWSQRRLFCELSEL